jgi:selenophosphate synthase
MSTPLTTLRTISWSTAKAAPMALGKTSPRTITIVLHLDTSRVSVANCLIGDSTDRCLESILEEAHHDLDDTVTNTNARMHEQIGTVKDLSKAHNKLAATVKDLQTTMQKQNEQLKYDTGQ